MVAESVAGTSYAGSASSSRSMSVMKQTRNDADAVEGDTGDGIWDRRSSLEYGVFGVLFTLSKEKSETRIRIRWILLKILLDAWQLFTTVINPGKQAWNINPDSVAWKVIGVLNFTWLADLGYGAYLAVLYAMLTLLAINLIMCIWVAWCFKEHKFPVVWPIQILRVFSSVFFQAFDVASLNVLQLGIRCRYTGPQLPHMHSELFPQYACFSSPHILHAVVSALCLVLFVAIALLLNMAEVEVNPQSRRPDALGHSGAEVAAFAIKVLLTLVDVFLGWQKVAACAYLAFSLALAYQYLRWSPHLVAWANYLKSGVAVSTVWCSIVLMLVQFQPGVKGPHAAEDWSDVMTLLMLGGLVPSFAVGTVMSWGSIRYMDAAARKALANPKNLPVGEAFNNFDEPRDIEIAARCCRNAIPPYHPQPDAINKAHRLIQAGLDVFPENAYMVLLHANFMIDVLGVTQSGARRIEDARKMRPSLMCRFVMFIRQQQATQTAAGNSVNSDATMDLLGYVEYQRKQRMVVRLHREALQAMCNFWRALDAHRVSFMALSKAISRIEDSVSQAQAAYRVVLERYGNNAKLVRLYGKFLQSVKNDPWRANEYFTEADRLEESQNGVAGGPMMPDGTPLARMDDLDNAVVLINASGVIQMANKHCHALFGYKRGTLEGKTLATLLAPHYTSWLTAKLTKRITVRGLSKTSPGEPSTIVNPAAAVAAVAADDFDDENGVTEVAVGLHSDRLAFPIKISLRKASGVGEDSTLVALIEPIAVPKDEASLWVSSNGTITACDPQFISNFGWKAADVNGARLSSFLSFAEAVLMRQLTDRQRGGAGGAGGPDEGGDDEAVKGRGGAVGDGTASALKRLVSLAASRTRTLSASSSSDVTAGMAAGIDPQSGLHCSVYHKFGRAPLECVAAVVLAGAPSDSPVQQLRLKIVSEPPQMLVVSRKGAILHASTEISFWLKDILGAHHPHHQQHNNHNHNHSHLVGGALLGLANREGGGAGGGGGPAAAAAAGGAASLSMPGTEPLAGYTLFDFLPHPWKDMHYKLLKDITPASLPVIGERSRWSCRSASHNAASHRRSSIALPYAAAEASGPTLALKSASGRELHMHVGVETADLVSEVVHIIHFSRSSLDEGLHERRMRLGVSPEGVIVGVEGHTQHLFGINANHIVGRGLWEVVEDQPSSSTGDDDMPAEGPLMAAAVVNRALSFPGHSWRVNVATPMPMMKPGAEASGRRTSILADVNGSRTGAKAKPAAIVVTLVTPEDIAEAAAAGCQHGALGSTDPDHAASVFIDLWPLASVAGVLELDNQGRIKTVLEDQLRPAGLLFGVPTMSLVGSMLGELVVMPAGNTNPIGLLSSNNKKSSLKSSSKESSAKVGPVHKLFASHFDGQPLVLEVQVIGKRATDDPVVALLRYHMAPMVPAQQPAGLALASPSPVPLRGFAQGTATAATGPTANDTHAAYRAAGMLRPGGTNSPRTRALISVDGTAGQLGFRPGAGSVLGGEGGNGATARLQLPAPPAPAKPKQPAAAPQEKQQQQQPREIPDSSTPERAEPETATRESSEEGGVNTPRMSCEAYNATSARDRLASVSAAVQANISLKQPRVTAQRPGDAPDAPAGDAAEYDEDRDLVTLALSTQFDDCAKPLLGKKSASTLGPATHLDADAAAGLAGSLKRPATTGTAGNSPQHLLGRNKLAEMVKAAGTGGSGKSAGMGAAAAGGPNSGDVDMGSYEGGDEEEEDEMDGGSVPQPSRRPFLQSGSKARKAGGAEAAADTGLPSMPSLPGSTDAAALRRGMTADKLDKLGADGSPWSMRVGSTSKKEMLKPRSPSPPPPDDDNESGASLPSLPSHDEELSQQGGGRGDQAAERVRDWVASKGAFYQNSVENTPKSAVRTSNSGKRPGSPPVRKGLKDAVPVAFPNQAFASAPGGDKPGGRDAAGPAGHANGTDFDDAGSEGGKSAMSEAQSADGTEYTRGKRYRKLIKLMDSPQAQKVQERLRIQTLIVVGLLAIVHIVCFVLTVTAIQTQKTAMASLSLSGQVLVDMHRIMTNVRSLDIITANRTQPNLFTNADTKLFLDQVAVSAEDLKERFNEILFRNSNPSSTVLDVLYHGHRAVWDHKDVNGSDVLVNVTIWDFATRFYTRSKNVHQEFTTALETGGRMWDTDSAQFLIKSGPDLWRDLRKILDALLYAAVSNTKAIDTLQIAFLVVEGAGISFMAACYLAFLLRTVAEQRYKLYGIFLAIPLGLTRALATLNTTNLLDDEEDDDTEEEVERSGDKPEEAMPTDGENGDNGGEGGVISPKLKRRATLKVVEDKACPGGGFMGADHRRGPSSNGMLSAHHGGPDRTLSAGSNNGSGRWKSLKSRVKGFFNRGRNIVMPLPPHALMGASIAGGPARRSLKADTRETYITLIPFIIWSALVVVFYSITVIKLHGMDDVVAIHSIVNFMAGRVYRAVFVCQELANVDNMTALVAARAGVYEMISRVRDAWYTVLLGATAYKATGVTTEQFALVKTGIAHASPELENLLYTSGNCHRLAEHMPCPDPGYRFYEISRVGVDSMMQQFMIHVNAMYANTSVGLTGLDDGHFDFIYNVGIQDLVDGVREISVVHNDTILAMFNNILVLHIVLFLLFWLIFAGFLIFLLNPLLKRVSRERRRIAELMSQLPMELDVEKLVRGVMGAGNTPVAGPGAARGQGGGTSGRFQMDDPAAGGVVADSDADTTKKWKASLRAANSVSRGGRPASMTGASSMNIR